MTADDWASAKSAEMMALLLNPDVTLDLFADILAWELRLTEATVTERTLRHRTPEDIQNEFERGAKTP